MKIFWISKVILFALAFIPCAMAFENKEVFENINTINEQDENGQAGNHTSEVPLTAGYEKNAANGFFIRSKDELFRLNVGAYTQARYDINWRDAANSEDDVEKKFSFNRTRLFFEGQYTPLFDYHFRINIDDENNSTLLVAYLQYNISEKWDLRIGRQFIALSREDWMWAQDTLTTEFSANDFTFALGTSAGFQAHYKDKKQRLWLALSDGTTGAKHDSADTEQANIALTGRWEYQLSGSDWSVWNDQVGRVGRSQGTLLGLAAGYQSENSQSSYNNTTQLIADISLNGSGYQLMLAASLNHHEPRTESSFNNYGMLVQVGYFLTTHMQTYAQYNLLSPGDQPGDLETFHSITAGLNYFPLLWTNRWKFSAELAHMFDTLNKTIVAPSQALGWLESNEAGQTYLRVQAQFGF